jgi:uncharacterized membrane protein YdjX (TVP38/TMEM64 family)
MTKALKPRPGFWKNHWRKLLAALFWLLALTIYITVTVQRGLSPVGSLELLITFMERSMWGPLIFLGLYTVRPLFLFSASLLSIAAGLLFGPVLGVIYTILGSNASASVAYLLGRFFGQNLLSETTTGLGRYLRGMRERSFETVFIMRLIFLPYDLVNYLAGILKIHYLPFITASALGSLPGTLAFVLFGASATSLRGAEPSFDWRVLAASVAIFFVSLLIARLVKRRQGELHD